MERMRILILAPGSNPDSMSTALVGYAHSEALARIHEVTLVAGKSHEAALCRRPPPFRHIVTIDTTWLDAVYEWIVHKLLHGDYGSHVLTALAYPFQVIFEWKAWRALRDQIRDGEYDVVLRLLPVVPTLPSPFAWFLRRGPIPFVIGPINGGLPWPRGFVQAERQKEWITRFRNCYRVLPFAKSTYHHAKAIVAGSSQTYIEFLRYREKLFFVPENGLSEALLTEGGGKPQSNEPLELVYVGRLVPYKACDLAIRGSAEVLRQGKAYLAVIGDGPERANLEQLAGSLGIKSQVSFCGWLDHDRAMRQVKAADVLVFPSIREFGGGVVFEALALGTVPIVVDFGGPGDIVNSRVGYKLALTNEEDMIAQIGKILSDLAGNRELLSRLQEQGMRYARESLSWDGKARMITDVLRWVTNRGSKPDLIPPKFLAERG